RSLSPARSRPFSRGSRDRPPSREGTAPSLHDSPPCQRAGSLAGSKPRPGGGCLSQRGIMPVLARCAFPGRGQNNLSPKIKQDLSTSPRIHYLRIFFPFVPYL